MHACMHAHKEWLSGGSFLWFPLTAPKLHLPAIGSFLVQVWAVLTDNWWMIKNCFEACCTPKFDGTGELVLKEVTQSPIQSLENRCRGFMMWPMYPALDWKSIPTKAIRTWEFASLLFTILCMYVFTKKVRKVIKTCGGLLWPHQGKKACLC